MIEFNMAKIMELPVIQQEPVRKTIKTQCGGEKPRVPSARFLARIQGNSKTEPNVSDTTKGCAGGCFGCYAARSMGFLQGGFFKDKETGEGGVGQFLSEVTGYGKVSSRLTTLKDRFKQTTLGANLQTVRGIPLPTRYGIEKQFLRT